MLELDSAAAETTLVSIAMHVFFYIASQPQPRPRTWVANASRKLPNMLLRDAARLFPRCRHALGPAVTVDTFKERLKGWRRIGGGYCFIARQLGLGSLVHVMDHIPPPPPRMGGCTKGHERFTPGIDAAADRSAHGSPSSRAFAHLHSLHLPRFARESGADDKMHDLLWAVGCVRAAAGLWCSQRRRTVPRVRACRVEDTRRMGYHNTWAYRWFWILCHWGCWIRTIRGWVARSE
ncbi:hypothetical protein BU26DRAFT_599982 [Trematosphaeria pertusa]|uniref:Uncharacterized protein n=1 Tax=Trematosphaeria pertusa TaxID=390896 RepID=A0A6A6IUQ0_9PLEO|nr:uncharacterized protein BU26DRAFT_599982 [Trematosphaeria pertusa]KAF2254174.1 hypothetical protein BU26DRAFT_599982 [Trematosphaeria pertusa]